jgi:hypothetical protein
VPSDLQNLQNGDLIFLDLDCGAPCDAIEDVTLAQFHVTSPRLSHVGAILREGHSLFVVEAWPDGGVRKTALSDVLSRVKAPENSPSGFYLGRFRDEFRPSAESALRSMLTLLGKGYDDSFLLNNDTFYCSELVMQGFLNDKTVSFKPVPMSFGEKGSPASDYWLKYYAQMGRPVPSGELGLSPLGIYLEGRSRFFK